MPVMASPSAPLRGVPPSPSPLSGETGSAGLFDDNRPPHTHTESTLAPTSEFMRYFLAAYPARYVFRGFFRTIFDDEKLVGGGWRNAITGALQKPGTWLHNMVAKHPGDRLSGTQSAFYNASLGIGSLVLTLSYSWTVYKDIKNLFCEAVGAELNKAPKDISYRDLRRSENKIVQKTMENFWGRLASRLATDALFLPATLMRKEGWGDFMLGLKGVQLFAGTWKRKTTLFEDMVSFVTNKINPRNGLGQPIAVGEIFDIYQHYAEQFHPERQFANVLEQGTGEGARWAQSQPIFQRITELMNKTYAYKHASILGPDGHAVKQANFTLPQFIYLLGHDLIDPEKPDLTLTAIELANYHGIPGVKQMQAMLAAGHSLQQIRQQLPYPAMTAGAEPAAKGDDSNTVIAKGSTLQLDSPAGNSVIAKGSTLQLDAAPPVQKIDASSIAHHGATQHATVLPNLV